MEKRRRPSYCPVTSIFLPLLPDKTNPTSPRINAILSKFVAEYRSSFLATIRLCHGFVVAAKNRRFLISFSTFLSWPSSNFVSSASRNLGCLRIWPNFFHFPFYLSNVRLECATSKRILKYLLEEYISNQSIFVTITGIDRRFRWKDSISWSIAEAIVQNRLSTIDN